MASFTCPKCKAQNEVGPGDAPGCKCCGYGASGFAAGPPPNESIELCPECKKPRQMCKGHPLCG